MAPWRGTLVKAINGRAVRIKSRKSSSPSTAALFALPFHGDHAVESLKAITKILRSVQVCGLERNTSLAASLPLHRIEEKFVRVGGRILVFVGRPVAEPKRRSIAWR